MDIYIDHDIYVCIYSGIKPDSVYPYKITIDFFPKQQSQKTEHYIKNIEHNLRKGKKKTAPFQKNVS